jgi:hypothetical protein
MLWSLFGSGIATRHLKLNFASHFTQSTLLAWIKAAETQWTYSFGSKTAFRQVGEELMNGHEPKTQELPFEPNRTHDHLQGRSLLGLSLLQ